MMGPAFPLAQLQETFFARQHGSPTLLALVIGTFVVSLIVVYFLLQVPTRLRRPIVRTVTFLGGAFWIVYWLWPRAQDRGDNELPRNFVEAVSFSLEDGVPIISAVAQTLAGLLLGLGVYSVLRIHLGRLVKKQRDWPFSLILLLSMVAMVIFGYWDWSMRRATGALYDDPANWLFPQYARDLLFAGTLQQMEAAMFSIIAFFIFSAAYRAFRIRSVEATVLLATALIVMLSLMGLVEYASARLLEPLGAGTPGALAENFTLASIADWIRTNVERPGIRALEFGVAIGALAMALRLWLSLERGGIGA